MSHSHHHSSISYIRNFLLLMLLWSQVCMAMPEVHEHADSAETISYAEIGDHVMVIPDSEHEHEDGSQHELHVHACSGHVTAMPVSLDMLALSGQALPPSQHRPHFSIRNPERLLRPPII